MICCANCKYMMICNEIKIDCEDCEDCLQEEVKE